MGRGVPPPRLCGPTDHTWLIPYGGENRSIMSLFSAVMSCGEPSFQNQIIVVNDSEEALGEFAPGVQVYHNKGLHHGCAFALNFGLAYVTTTWIWRMDADDAASGGHNRLIACQEADENVVLLGGEMMTQDYRHLKNRWDSNNILQLLTLHRNPIHHPATCLRTSAVLACGGWPEDCGQVEDYGLWCSLIGLGKFVAINNVWTNYTQGVHTHRQELMDIVAERRGW